MGHLCNITYTYVVDVRQSSGEGRMNGVEELDCFAASHAYSTCANWCVQIESYAKCAYFRLTCPAHFISHDPDSEFKRHPGLAVPLYRRQVERCLGKFSYIAQECLADDVGQGCYVYFAVWLRNATYNQSCAEG